MGGLTEPDLAPILRVNRIPFVYSPSRRAKTPSVPHRPRPPEDAHPAIYLAKIKDGLLIDTSPLAPMCAPMGTQDHIVYQPPGSMLIPFHTTPRDEPIITLHDETGHTYDVYIDTGAEADLIPRRLLELSFPSWRRDRTGSQTKLVAANNTPIAHEGRVSINLPLPGPSPSITINPFIVNSPADATTLILGYPTLKLHGLVPIPGSGLLCTHKPASGNQTTDLGRGPGRYKFSSIAEAAKPLPKPDCWEARPLKPHLIKPHKRTSIQLKPRNVPPEDINARNGTKALVRRCPCVLSSECEECVTSLSNVQICSFVNGILTYVVDNTRFPTSYMLTPKDPFFITFQDVFQLDEVAKTAIACLSDMDFEIQTPVNPYSESECKDLFQKTREEVSATLRSIAAEPETFSLTGIRPATLRLIGCDGMEKVTPRTAGDPVPLAEFANINPCTHCKKTGASFCNVDTADCELRKYSRRHELPDVSHSTIIDHESQFHPTDLPPSPAMVVGCHRDVNNHKQSWKLWFPPTDRPKHLHLTLHSLYDAVVTEVSKASLLEVSSTATSLGIKEIHFTNFTAYGVSRNMLMRCLADQFNIHIYYSDQVAVAGPAHDPRKRGPRPPPSSRPLPHGQPLPNPDAASDTGPIPVNPGMPKPLLALRPEDDYSKVSILTNDPKLKKRCKAILTAHDSVFAKTPTEVGQFVDCESGRPYLFQVRLKGLPPVRHKTRFVSAAKEEAATQLVAALLANGVVKRRFSNYNSQSVYVAKKRKQLSLEEHIERGFPASSFVEGTIDTQAPLQLRLCVDMTAANLNIVPDNVCTLSPRMLVQRLAGCGSAASLDLAHAYHSLTLSESSQMISGWEPGLPNLPSRMVFCRAQMGMASSAKWLEVALAKTLSQAHGKYLRWADDIIVTGSDDDDMLSNLSCVLDLLSSHGWKIKQEKLTIFAKQLLVFGMKIDLTSQQISIPRADLDAVLLRARPASPVEMRSFCGSIAWFAENLGNHAHATALLHKMTRKDGSYTWNEDNLQAYETIQEFMSKPVVYTSLPNFDLPFHMVSDSSEHATGCLLLQMSGPEDLRIISYKSHIHDLRTSRLSSHERESYAMIFCISSFYDIIAGRPSTIYSDSQASVLLSLMSRTNSKVARWLCLLRSLPFLRVSWISSKTPILRLCDYLSRRPATSRQWKNRMASPEDLSRVSLAASKLKRDTLMSLAHHDVLMEYVCHLPNESLEEISDESLYIDQNGNVRSTDTDDNTTQHASIPGDTPTLEADSLDPPSHLNHPAFLTRSEPQPTSVSSAGDDGVLNGKPNQVQSSGTETELVQQTEEAELFLDLPLDPIREQPTHQTGDGGMTRRGRPAANAQPCMTPLETPKATHASSVYRIRAHSISNHLEDPYIYPPNLLSMDEAEELTLLDPSSKPDESPKDILHSDDRPSDPAPGDKEAAFLSLCFELSPWMTLSDLISKQDSDPKLKLLKEKSTNAPYVKGNATYLLKEGVLLRKHHADRLENLQICLDQATGYSLCLKAHLGSGRGTYRHSLGPALHHAPKKMISLISSRFFFDNMAEICKQIASTCYICQEGKHSIAASRTDAHRRVITPTAPAEAWSLDLLELPGSGGKGGKLLTGMDLFSNFGIAICVDKSPTSEYLFDLIQWQIFTCHSRPRFLLCDNASYWRSEAFKQAVTQLNIELRTIPAYSAKSSPVEHLNKLIIKHLRLLHQHHNIPHSQWRRSLPSVLNAINFSPYGGPLGQIHKLSPARVFYGDTRQSLDPSARFDLPFLAHRFKGYVDFVKRVADANWAVQQVMEEHREALQRSRLKVKGEHNRRFDSIRSYRMGDVILFDRKLPPGVASKLRPRAPYRFVVLGETDSCVYVRPWESACIEKWLSAQKLSKQSKDATPLLPLIKLPKERTRLDKSLKLYSSHSRIPEHHLLKDMSLPDPQPLEIEVEEYGPTDWTSSSSNRRPEISITDPEDGTCPTDPDPGPEPIPTRVQTSTRSGSEPGPAPAPSPCIAKELSSNAGFAGQHLSKPIPGIPGKPGRSILRHPHLRRSKRLQKQCRFSNKVSVSDGSTRQVHTGPSTCFRIFRYPENPSNPMEDIDRLSSGDLQDTYKGVIHITPGALYDRKCACRNCRKQIPHCRSTPCTQCVAI